MCVPACVSVGKVRVNRVTRQQNACFRRVLDRFFAVSRQKERSHG